MEINEFGPGLGFWISVAVGLVVGIVTLAWGAGWLIAAAVWVVVTLVLILMLS